MSTIKSPCIRNCCLNDQDICIGCSRSLNEIIRWGSANDSERLQMLSNVEKRKVITWGKKKPTN